MSHAECAPIGYVLKRYPRYSETFVVNEILAHEAAGCPVEIFSLRFPEDGHFQDAIARVRAQVTYLPAIGLRAMDLWAALEEATADLPGGWSALEAARGVEARHVHQALVLACQVGRKRIRHLHAHFATEAATVTRLAARFAGVPYSLTAHAKDIFHEDVQPEDLARKLYDARPAITVSDFNAEYLRRRYGSAAVHVERVYNGLDLEGFRFREPRDRPARIAAVGRLVEKKGFADLIEACAILSDRGLDFRCEIVGTGSLEDELRAQVQRLGLEKKVQLVGPRPREDVIRHLQGAAVCAAPCVIGSDGNRDGLPTVLLEAMALGTPCVSTNVVGIPELVRDRETGLAVSPHEPPALAGAIEELFANAPLRVALARRARTLIEAEFDVRRNAARLRAIFGIEAGPEAERAAGSV